MSQTIPHDLPIHPALATGVPVLTVEAAAWRKGSAVHLQYRIAAARPLLVMPTAGSGERRDGLWQHTCCELFLGAATGSAYLELNLSPAGDWALYHFSGYRIRTTDLTAETPTVRTQWKGENLWVDAAIDVESWKIPWLAGQVRVGLSAVLEFDGSTRAYHALAHARDVPDFHDERGWCAALECFQKAEDYDANRARSAGD